MCMTGKPTLICHGNASVVSTCLTVVDNSCVMNHQEGTPVVRRMNHADIGAAMYWEGEFSG